MYIKTRAWLPPRKLGEGTDRRRRRHLRHLRHRHLRRSRSMANGGKGAKGGGKDERRAKKATQNRDREHRRESRRALDRSELTQFAVLLKGNSLLLREVERDGNCFFRSLADQIEDCEHNHAEYRVKVMDYVERHKEDFEPFFSFGEGEDEEDADFSEYIARMRVTGRHSNLGPTDLQIR